MKGRHGGHGPYGGFSGIFKSVGYIIYYCYIFVPLYIAYEWFVGNKPLHLSVIPNRPGQIVVITGANRGVGAAAVKLLLELEMHVVAGVRNIQQMNQVFDDIRKLGVTSGTIDIFYLDLTDFVSVREFATKVKEKYPCINCLINNAAIMNAPYTLTVSGFEQQFQVNYLCPFLLANLLLPNIIKASTEKCHGIILDVSSIAQYSGKLDFDNLNSEKWYNCMAVYGNSKLAQTCANHYLGIKLKQLKIPIRTANVHPGVLGTGLWNMSFWYKGIVKKMYHLIIGTAENGANELIFTAFHPDVQHETGMYYNYRRSDPKSPKVSWKDIEKLWEVSCKMVNIVNTLSVNSLNLQNFKDNTLDKYVSIDDLSEDELEHTSDAIQKSQENSLISSHDKNSRIAIAPIII